tara:strand:+ start:2486 stop:3334 length:849 start_codon:yes stop_codon:yes gene_type:complete
MKKLIFVADFFAEDYSGGAELTTEALLQKCAENYTVQKIHCKNLTENFLLKNKDAKYVICNFASLDNKIKIAFCKHYDYQIVEYDYKFCEYRSIEKHLEIEGKGCSCVEGKQGKINKIFYGYAKKLWFMSEIQKNIFLKNVSTIKEERCEVLSSIFSDGDIRFMNNIKDNEKDNNYLILDSGSWIKDTKGCIEYAKKNNLNYQLIKGLPYNEMLIKMSTSKGLIFRPCGGDTCPRIVIEAMMLGCDLKLNEHVQHKNEVWFSDQEKCYNYMSTRANYFMENV